MGQKLASNGTYRVIEWDAKGHRMGQNRLFSYLNHVPLHPTPTLYMGGGGGYKERGFR